MSRYGYLVRRSTTYFGSLSLVLAQLGVHVAQAHDVLPLGASIVSTSTGICKPSARTLTINQSSPTARNCELSSTPSPIDGRLNANGQVFLINPNCIAIAPFGTANVAFERIHLTAITSVIGHES